MNENVAGEGPLSAQLEKFLDLLGRWPHTEIANVRVD